MQCINLTDNWLLFNNVCSLTFASPSQINLQKLDGKGGRKNIVDFRSEVSTGGAQSKEA